MYKVEVVATFELNLPKAKRSFLRTQFELPFLPAEGLVVILPGDFHITLNHLKWSTEDQIFKAGFTRSFPSEAALEKFNSPASSKSPYTQTMFDHEADNDFEIERSYYLENGWTELK